MKLPNGTDYPLFSKSPVSVSSSRKIGTTYTNNKGYPIQSLVSVDCSVSSSYRQANIELNGGVAATHYIAVASQRQIVPMYAIVPPGATYAVASPSGGVTAYRWYETP